MSYKDRLPPNKLIACETRWQIPVALLCAATVFTFIWAFYLIDFEFDDFEVEHYAIQALPSAHMQPIAANNSQSIQGLVAPAVVHIHDIDLPKVGNLPKVLSSGVIVHPAGYLVTTYHALNGRETVKVDVPTAAGIQRYSAEVISTDRGHDLALLKMKTKDRFMFLKLADKATLLEGLPVFAYGFGMQSTLLGKQGILQKRGVVTQVGNQNLTRLLMTNAVYTWEQSGGALVNARGELVGINLAIKQDGAVNGYAIPSHVIEHAFKNEVKLTVIGMQQQQAAQAQAIQPQTQQAIWPGMVNVATGTPVVPGSNAAGAAILPTDQEHGDLTLAGYNLDTVFGLALLGLVAGIAGGMMTMGGGIILVTGMLVFFGYGMYLIRPVSYITNLFTYGAAAYRNWNHGLVMMKEVMQLTPWAVIGVLVGYFIGTEMNDIVIGYLLGIFALLAMAKAVHEIYTKHEDSPVVYSKGSQAAADQKVEEDDMDILVDDIEISQPSEATAVPRRKAFKISFKDGLLGLPMGLVSGVLGISGGVVEVPLQRYLSNISLRNAIANSSVMVFWTSMTAAVVSFIHGSTIGAFEWQTPFALALIMIPSSYLGGMIGANLLKHVSANKLRGIYAVLMLIVAVKMLFGQ